MRKSAALTALFLAFSANAQAQGQTRTEHDLLGEKQVPADAYYGIQTARALENFQISSAKMDTYPEFIDAFAAESTVFEQAYTHSPQTLPAHTSILSGELPFRY